MNMERHGCANIYGFPPLSSSSLDLFVVFAHLCVCFSQVPMMNKRFLRKQRMHELLSESSDHISNTFHISSRDVIETRVPKKELSSL